MNINRKKIIIYGIGRFSEDFLYLFPKVNICGYIVSNKKQKEYKGYKCYYEDNVDRSLLKHKLLVICERRSKKIDKFLEKLNLVSKKDYYYLEDLGYLLNDKKDEFSAKFYKWYHLKIKKWKEYPDYVPNSIYFKEMIYRDSIDNIKCQFPFEYVQIQPKGYVYPCCSGWVKKEMGNITFKKPKEVWNSNLARLHRLSIINKTYTFCDIDSCPFMKKRVKTTNTRFTDLKETKSPTTVCVAIDNSCNLKCKSCRKNFHNVKKGRHLKTLDRLATRIVESNWANDADELIMASQGEVFFSTTYRKMLFDSKITERDSIVIHTNGTLLTKKNLDRLCSIYKDIEIMISVDATTEETYKKIRCGGNFKQLMKNLENLSVAKKEGRVRKVNLLFVVQRDNYQEMPDFVRLVKRLDFDIADFSKIGNWGTFTDKEFEKISMFDENENPKEELVSILKDPIFKDKKVKADSNVFKSI